MIPLSKVAPELRRATGRMTRIPLPFGSNWGRRTLRWLTGLVPEAKPEDVRIDTPDDTPVGLRIYDPGGRNGGGGALLWIHGGGYIIGSPKQDDPFLIATARELGLLIVSVDYRLAPEHPFPAPLDDCHDAWTWMQAQALVLGIDPLRIAIGGQSAGGGLAAALVQRIYDEGGAQPAAQWLFCPMLDDRTAARTELDGIGHRLWSNRNNRSGWSCYLGQEPGAAELPPYAAPARREKMTGMATTWIGVGDIDLFHQEDRAYADRLREAGVAVEFVEVPGAPHGFEAWAPNTLITKKYLSDARGWLRAALDLSPPMAGPE
ncbi:MAG TPA: alpha/beta hydrolase [Sphingobium sp.]|uniref:alpha/beta hydrolase n=1 Tax=Sphingobium sp. TaxID=1912891 RepID=UPI002ED470D8